MARPRHFVAASLVFASCMLSSFAAVPPVSRETVCQTIKNSISSASDVYSLGDVQFEQDLKHWASSSSQRSECSVQPGTAADVAVTIQILAAARKPFAVKGGGHASNPKWSSTTGVHISMTRFNEVSYDAVDNTVTIGTGLIWDDVYAVLDPLGVGVVGGRVSGVGVAGFTLGGGYGWTTNQYGLTVDTITSFELVKPNGAIVTVTQASDSELFFGLKGGQNNFGIVTRFKLRAHTQGQVWGGLITFGPLTIHDLMDATTVFSAQVTDPKASIITAVNALAGVLVPTLSIFYDGPNPPPGIFDAFLAIPHVTKDIKTRSFLDLVKAAPAGATGGTRGIFHSVPTLEYSETFMDAVLNETIYWGTHLVLGTDIFVSYDIEPFLPSAFNSALPGSEAAYPPNASRSRNLKPTNLYFAWAPDLLGLISLLELDKVFHNAVKESARHLTNVAQAEGQNVASAPLYPNYAIFDTPLEKLYGENVGRLRALKQVVDPNNVMGLAGGFKL